MITVLEVTAPGLAYIVLGGFTVLFSTVSLLVKEKFYINEVVLGTAFGVLMGPHCANIFDPRAWGSREHEITLEVMRVVLVTGLFAIGVELPQSYLARHIRGLSVTVIPTMAFGWVVVSGILKALIPNLTFVSCLAISACLTPTDPVICAAIVGGKFALKHVPTNLRRLLSAESATNDGLAYPFLTVALYLTVEPTTREAIGKWFLVGWLYQVILGSILGAVIGYFFCKLMRFSQHKGYIDRESYVAQYIALAIFTTGVCSTLGTDDLLGAFAAGTAVSWDGHFNSQTEHEVFSSVIDLVLNCAAFIYIGAWLPFDTYNMPELGVVPWKLVVLFLCILAVRRIPSLLLLYKFIPEITSWKEALFSGHFGPMGVGAVFVSTLAVSRLQEPENPPRNQEDLLGLTLQPIVSFVVLGSILIHGLSIPFFTLSRRVHSRTVSMTQTLTSRQTSLVPEWLLSTRTGPQVPRRDPATDADLERGSDGATRVAEGKTDSDAKKGKAIAGDDDDSAVDSAADPVSDPSLGAPVRSQEQTLADRKPGFVLGEEGMIMSGAEGRTQDASVTNKKTQETTPVRTNPPSGSHTPSGTASPTVRFEDDSAGDLRKRLHARLDGLVNLSNSNVNNASGGGAGTPLREVATAGTWDARAQ